MVNMHPRDDAHKSLSSVDFLGGLRVSANVLREFLHRSREWSRARRGLELFETAAADLQELADADTGFFVYRKRAMLNGVTPQKPMVYVPWGAFANDIEELQSLMEEVVSTKLHLMTPLMERWILAEDMPRELQTRWERYGLLEVGIWPLISREKPLGAIVVAKTQAAVDQLTLFTRMALLDACAAQISLALDLILTSRIAEEASQRDLLTGLLNRRGLESRLPDFIEQCRENARFLIFGLIDLDDLKLVNDTKGHPAGDEALREVAEIIQRNVRSSDLVARLGGDEFAVVVESDEPDVESVMFRIREAVESDSHGLSASVGGAMWGMDGSSLEACYKIADQRLYECKRLSKSEQQFQ